MPFWHGHSPHRRGPRRKPYPSPQAQQPAAAPFAQYNWPNPSGPQRALDLLTWTESLLQNTLAAAAGAALTSVLRAPLVTRYTPPRWQPPDVPPNLLPGLLGAVAAPFNQDDWPNPRGAVSAPVGLTDSYKLLLFQETIPSSQRDWPVPKGQTPVITQGTWLQNHLLDTLAFAPTPFSQADWPVPKGPTPVVDHKTWLHDGGQRLFQETIPSLNFDWPVPPGARALGDLRTWLGNLLQSTLSFNPVPFNLTDWPVPKGPTPVVDLKTWTQDYKRLLFVETIPSINLDWPSPRGPVPALDLRTVLVNLLQTTLGAVRAPFNLTNWPNPSGPSWRGFLPTHYRPDYIAAAGSLPAGRLLDWPNPRGLGGVLDLRTLLVNLQQSTLGAVVQSPFFRTDWPNPRGPVPVSGLTAWAEGYKLLLFQESIPYQVTDWPNPRGPVPAAGLTTWLDTYKLNLFQESIPSLNFDWPSPRGPQRALDLLTWLNVYRLLLFQESIPYLVTEWPNPRGPQRAVVQDQINLLNALLSVQAPFAQLAWPNPMRPQGVIDLLTWLDNLLQTTMTVQPVGSPFYQTDWPNPRGPQDIIALRTLLQLVPPPQPISVDILIRLLRGIGL